MALDTGFVAAVLEGIEGTLDEVIERVETSVHVAVLLIRRQRYASAADRRGAAPRAIILSSVRIFNISWRRG